MKATRRLLMPIAPVFLALSACGISPTGVVEAGGPASGIAPVTPLYFVRDGVLVAVHRATARPGDAQAALRMLLAGPTPAETDGRLSTEVPGPPRAPATPFARPTAARAPEQSPPDGPTVTVKGAVLSIRLPFGLGALSRLATEQVICTAAAAHRVGEPSGDALTVTVSESDGGGWHAQGTDEDCPDP